ncbi:MAG: hypothetical protein JW774_12185 [Candidatus Aureabacteria bacterium]|nr:hypothetical protein [Candidatus Auribacterota bacterium]
MKKYGLCILTLFIVVIFSGCATFDNVGTKPLPLSEPVQPFIGLSSRLKNKTVGVYLSIDQTKIDGGHYEGLLQAKQVWITAPSKKQKAALYGPAKEVSLYSFMDELGRQGLLIHFIKEWNNSLSTQFDYVITGTIEKIILNTYGRGFIGGYGSAGDYWEARIFFTGIKLIETASSNTIYEDNMETYAKLAPCPIKLNWSLFTVVSNSLSMAFQVPAKTFLGTVAQGRDAIYSWKATYQMDNYMVTPIEVASRKGACELLKRIKETKSP